MKLTLFSRLIISYLTIFSLVTVVSVYAILKLHQLNRGTRQMLRVNTPILDYVQKLTNSILEQLRYQKKYTLTRDILLYDQFLSAKGDFKKVFSEALSIADTEEKRESLRKIKAHLDRFQSSIDKENEYVRKNQPYSKRTVEQEIEKSADGILDELSREAGISVAEIARRLRVGASAIAMAINRKNS